MTLESIAKYKLNNVSQCELNENIGLSIYIIILNYAYSFIHAINGFPLSNSANTHPVDHISIAAV